KISAGTVSNTEFDFLNGVTSAIQTQLDAKVDLAGDTMTGDLNMNGNKVLAPGNIPFTAANPTVTEDGKALRWNDGNTAWEWFLPAVAGSGITSLGGQTGNTQVFAIDLTTGTAPAWNSATDTHTLRIPMAADA